jgi:hypothetical protein
VRETPPSRGKFSGSSSFRLLAACCVIHRSLLLFFADRHMFGRGKRVEAVSSHMPSAIIAQAERGEGRCAFLIEIDQSRQTQRESKLIKGEIVGRPLPSPCCAAAKILFRVSYHQHGQDFGLCVCGSCEKISEPSPRPRPRPPSALRDQEAAVYIARPTHRDPLSLLFAITLPLFSP